MRPSVVAIACLLVACGRIDFDARSDGSVSGDGARAGDGGGDGNASAIEYLQGSGADVGPVTSLGVTLPSNLAVGDLVIAGISFDGPPPTTTVTDSLGSSFTIISAPVAAPLVAMMAYAIATTAGPEAITVTVASAPNSYLELQVWTYAGISPTNPFDDAAQNNGTTTATDGATTPPLTVTTTNELLFAWGTFFTTGHVGTGFTQVTNINSDPAEDRIYAVPGAYPATMTLDPAGGNFWTIVGATFRGI